MVKINGNQKKRLLIYAHYYFPDVASTGQILKELAEGLLCEFDITVICVVPSYTGKVSSEYKTKLFYEEEINGVKIIRVRVPEFSKNNKISRIKNIIAYFFGAMAATFKVGKIDYVYSISQPPILGGLLGVWGKWVKFSKYIYNIQDFNPEQTIAVEYSKNNNILKIMMYLDKFSCKRADKVIVVGRDMVGTLQDRFKHKNVPKHVFINNWIDESEIYPLSDDNEKVLRFKKKYGLENKYIVMYSGNIGLYYDLENLLKKIGEFPKGTKAIDGREVIFAFVGDGSVKEKLVEFTKKTNMENVIFIPYQDKSDLIYSLNASDCQLCISAAGIKGVSVPSKLYGIMAAGKPVLGVLEEESEACLLINEIGNGLIGNPNDYNTFEKNLKKFFNMSTKEHKVMGNSGRKYLEKNLTKNVSVSKYIKEINCS